MGREGWGVKSGVLPPPPPAPALPGLSQAPATPGLSHGPPGPQGEMMSRNMRYRQETASSSHRCHPPTHTHTTWNISGKHQCHCHRTKGWGVCRCHQVPRGPVRAAYSWNSPPPHTFGCHMSGPASPATALTPSPYLGHLSLCMAMNPVKHPRRWVGHPQRREFRLVALKHLLVDLTLELASHPLPVGK